MTAVRPSKEEVDEVARLLAKVDAASHLQLRMYLNGQMEWDRAIPIIKRRLLEILFDPHKQLRRDVRDKLTAYAAKYGLQIKGHITDETASVRKGVRWTPSQWDEIEAAARKAGVSVTDWIRDTTVAAARREEG